MWWISKLRPKTLFQTKQLKFKLDTTLMPGDARIICYAEPKNVFMNNWPMKHNAADRILNMAPH